jgi:ribose transport system substrate-binding protein
VPATFERGEIVFRPTRLTAAAAAAGLVLAAAGCGSSDSPRSAAGKGGSGGGDRYAVYLSNSFLGNDWRQQMEHTAEAVAAVAPLDERVDLTIVNTENDPTKQIQSLNGIILKKPDAILIDASSPDALNAVIARACAQRITVISFDQVVTADCAYKVHTDFKAVARLGASWLAQTLGGRGEIIMDRGLAGNPISLDMVDGFEEALAEFPDIEVAGTYESQYALAPEEQGASSLIAAHPQIDGVLSQAYGTGVQKALRKAGREPIAMVAQAYNGTLVQCATLRGIECAVTSNPATLGAEALRLAVDVLDGREVENEVILPSPAFSTNDVEVEGAEFQRILLGKTALPDLPPGATLPFSPSWAKITPAQALGNQ